jgi:pyridoxine 4-dehydrogenase
MDKIRRNEMLQQIDLGGRIALPGTSMSVNRMGYGATQLAGPQVWGPSRDVDVAIAPESQGSDAANSL